MSTGEDRAMVEALLGGGATVHFDSTTRVTTSSRRHARAPDGFAAALQHIEATGTRRSQTCQAALAIDERATG